MDFGFSQEQEMLRATARKFFENECTSTFVRARMEEPAGVTDEFWTKLAEQGWLATMPLGAIAVDREAGDFFLPAAVYVGSSDRGVVRLIDVDVADLINRAEASGSVGGDHSGGAAGILGGDEAGAGAGVWSRGLESDAQSGCIYRQRDL